MTEEFYKQWMSAQVEITKGPFAGRVGQVTACFNPRVEVAFPGSILEKDRIWFDVQQVRKMEPKGAAA